MGVDLPQAGITGIEGFHGFPEMVATRVYESQKVDWLLLYDFCIRIK